MLSGLLDWGDSKDVRTIQGPLLESWHCFIEGETLKKGQIRPVIHEAWKRCRANKVDYNLEKAPVRLPVPVEPPPPPSILLKEASSALLTLGETLKDQQSIAALCDKTGQILAIEGDPVFAEEVAERKNFRVGARWSENDTGNNAIGTALTIGQPHQVFSAEHYCRSWHDYVCTAVPIFDPFSEEILGVLDITGTISNFHRYAYAQLLHVVRMIEMALFHKGLAREYLFNREVMQTMNALRSEAIVVADAGGAVRVCTAAAKECLRDIAIGKRELPLLVQRLFGDRRISRTGTYETIVRIREHAVPVRVVPLIHDKVLLGAIITFTDYKSTTARHPRNPEPAISCPIIGDSPALAKARLKAEKVAPFDSTVLLEGESGTGKELFARLIHAHSPRGDGPFIALNCAAIPPDLMASELFGYESGSFTGARAGGQKGKLELSHHGTLFLDEISEMPTAIQVILLRFLQEKEFYRVGGTRLVRPDVRIIAATNRPLRDEMTAGRFREDLYYRLKVITIELPPLRHRREDIPLLVTYFLKRLASETGQPEKTLDEPAMAAVTRYEWPGNVRELRNTVEYAFVMSDGPRIRLHDLPEEIVSLGTPAMPATRADGPPDDREALLRALEENRWNVSRAARHLGVARATLYRRMKRFGISVTRHLSRS